MSMTRVAESVGVGDMVEQAGRTHVHRGWRLENGEPETM